MPNPKLKVGFIVDDFALPAWAAAVVEAVRSSDVADVASVILRPPENLNLKANLDVLISLEEKPAAGSHWAITTGGFWEVYHKKPLTELRLESQGKVLDKAYVPTYTYSVRANRTNAYQKAASLVLRGLRKLQRGVPFDATPASTIERRGLFDSAVLIFKMLGRCFGKAVHKTFFQEQWCIAYKRDASDNNFQNLEGLRFLVPPPDRYWADPFPIQKDGRHYIFVEEFLYAENKAHIAYFEVSPDGSLRGPMPALEAPTHLSYPFVFEFEGKLYMIPESSEKRTIDIYQCAGALSSWKKVKSLMENVSAMDATLALIKGQWWMFTNVSAGGTSSEELHAFYSTSPFGPWTAHALNPIKMDARSSRPAGNLFQRDGVFYRPAQDCSIAYGHAISLQRIALLSEDNFVEGEAQRIEPTWNPRISRTHTVNQAGGLLVLDGFRYAFRWRRFWRG